MSSTDKTTYVDVMARGAAFLEQHGTKGMKWGVRKDKGHEGERTKTKKIVKLDKKFERNSQTLGTVIKLHNRAAELTNKNDVDRINNKPEYKNADFRRDSPLRQTYYKEHEKAFLDNLDKAAAEFGTNASGTKKYSIIERPDGSWDVSVDAVQHAVGSDVPDVHVTYDDMGRIVSLEVNDNVLVQSDPVNDFLAHHGVKGMKWGVRKERSGPSGVSVTQKKPGGKVKTSGGQGHPIHPDAAKALEVAQKAKSSRTHALSNAELKAVNERMQLEQNFARLSNDKKSAGRKFLEKMFKNPNERKRTMDDLSKIPDAIHKVNVGKTILDTDLSKIGN